MKLARPGFWVALVSALLVVWFVWHDRARVSPGELAAAHAQDSRLRGDSCEACHGEEDGGMAAACGQCHTAIQQQIDTHQGLHGKLVQDAGRCALCHSDHHGSQFALVTVQSFARAGIPDPLRFEHEGLDYALGGRHIGLACEKCHENANATLLARDTRRFLGESQRCEGCHQDPHEGKLPDCRSCHGEERPFAEAPLFQHTASFPLREAHAGVACQKCHDKAGPTSIESSGAAERAGRLQVRACESCHAAPHATGFLAAAATASRTPRESGCVACHPLTAKGFGREEAVFSADQHSLSGFALVAPHDTQKCADCHAAGLEYARAHPGRKLESCTSCHTDPHQGQFGAQGCLECHEPTRWKPSRIDVGAHARSGFALEAKHATAACGDCHLPRAGVQAFRGTPRACDACHEDVHEGSFAEAKGCQECHAPDSFTAAAQGFDHARWTGFAVDGAHERAGCESCHVPTAAPDARKRRFGRVVVHAPARAGDCSNCHADAHGGFFGGSRGCAECHSTRSFSPALAGFDHGARTGFALEGAHLRAECTTCHAPAAARDANGRAFGFARVQAAAARASCTGCHADPHEATFADSQGCLDCHTQESWKDARAGFDHLRWSGFALAGMHARTGCESCHTPLANPLPGGRRLARAAGTDCADCHADPHVGQFAIEGRTDCARCHADPSRFEVTSFDHQRDSRFALDETHRKLACGACHLAWPLQGGGRAVRYKPLGTVCGDCHDTRR